MPTTNHYSILTEELIDRLMSLSSKSSYPAAFTIVFCNVYLFPSATHFISLFDSFYQQLRWPVCSLLLQCFLHISSLSSKVLHLTFHCPFTSVFSSVVETQFTSRLFPLPGPLPFFSLMYLWRLFF